MKREAQMQLSDHRPALRRLERRVLLKSSISAGALTMLTGCNLQDGDTVDRVLWAMSRWNDRVQRWDCIWAVGVETVKFGYYKLRGWI